jgi:transposase
MLRNGEEWDSVHGMLTYEQLSSKSGAFKSLTGLSIEEFQGLLGRVRPRYEALARSQTERADRKRAPGGGLKSRHDLTQRLLMTMVWLKLYVTCEAVGFMFGVDKGTVSRFTRPILRILRELGEDTLGWPEEARELAEPAEGKPNPPEKPAGQSEDSPDEPWGDDEHADEDDGSRVVTPDQSDCPDYLAIVDATEQRTERSSDYATQRKYYSGKRKCHTIKTQVIVNEHGRIRHLSDSVPGSTHDLTLLRQSGMTDELPEGLTVMGDCGYRGMQKAFPRHSVALPYRPKAHQELTPEEKLHNHFISSLRVVVENTLCQLKHFRALDSVFRHCLERYNDITRAIAGIVNWRIDKRLATQST